MGLIAMMILAIFFTMVSVYYTNQTRVANTIEKSAGCSEIANSISDYLKQDESTVFVNSVGVDSDGTYANFANNLTNIDGNSRFAFTPNIQAFSSNATTFTVPDDKTPIADVIPNGTTFTLTNYLNINSSFNRIIAMSYAANICSGSGATIYDNTSGNNTSLIDGVTIDRPNTRVTLQVNISEGSQSLCSETGLTKLPSIFKSLTIKYAINVTVNTGSSSEQNCSASGTVTAISDPEPPIALMHISTIDTASRCNVQSGGAYCIAGARRQTNDIVASVRTVFDDSACRNCLASAGNKYNSCNPNLTNVDLGVGNGSSCEAQCRDSDPGSIFFCRLTHREQTTNLSSWWPCHNKPANIPGTVSIVYEDVSGSISSTQTTTLATITVSNLAASSSPTKDWLLDVRAVDTSGILFGRAFTNAATQFNDTPADYDFDDCSCDGSCVWRTTTTGCPAAGTHPAPDCNGNPVGTELPIQPQQFETVTAYCADPSNTSVAIDPENCIAPNPGSTAEACELPCVAGATPPNYQCDNSSPTLGPCVGSPQMQTQVGQCQDVSVTPALIVANTNCAGGCQLPDVACGSTPTYSCQNPGGWSTCTPTCTEPCQETQTSECVDDATGDPAPGMCGVLNCVETRTNYAESCTFTCDTSAVTASACSPGACNVPGTVTYSGAVCRDSSNNIVDVSNCGGECNPPPSACDRNCAFNCVAEGDPSPLTCPGAPVDCAVQTTQYTNTTCKYSDGTSSAECAPACAPEPSQCPVACSDCGSTPHGGEVRTTTYTASQNSCEERTCAGLRGPDFVQTCNNGTMNPASIPGGTITSCTENTFTDGTWQCSPGRTADPGSCSGTTPHFAVCGNEAPECLKADGTPADCCESSGAGNLCGRCVSLPTQICYLPKYKNLLALLRL